MYRNLDIYRILLRYSVIALRYAERCAVLLQTDIWLRRSRHDVDGKIIAQLYGIWTRPLPIIQYTTSIPENNMYKVLHCGLIGEKFTVQTSIKQGCVLFSLFFILVLNVENECHKKSGKHSGSGAINVQSFKKYEA